MEELKKLKSQFNGLYEDPSKDTIENTALRLKGMKFSPTLLIELDDFNHATKKRVLAEVDRIISLSDEELIEEGMTLPTEPDIFRMNHLKLLYYFYELLTRLRRDDPDAWDEINELYEDD